MSDLDYHLSASDWQRKLQAWEQDLSVRGPEPVAEWVTPAGVVVRLRHYADGSWLESSWTPALGEPSSVRLRRRVGAGGAVQAATYHRSPAWSGAPEAEPWPGERAPGTVRETQGALRHSEARDHALRCDTHRGLLASCWCPAGREPALTEALGDLPALCGVDGCAEGEGHRAEHEAPASGCDHPAEDARTPAAEQPACPEMVGGTACGGRRRVVSGPAFTLTETAVRMLKAGLAHEGKARSDGAACEVCLAPVQSGDVFVARHAQDRRRMHALCGARALARWEQQTGQLEEAGA